MDDSVLDHIQTLAQTDIEELNMDDVQTLITSTNVAFQRGGITSKERDDIRTKLDRLQRALLLAPVLKVRF